MKILLTGATGQVGFELARSLQGIGQVHAFGRSRMDLADLDQVRAVIRALRPELIVNPAAYTAVDLAESEPELAWRINAEAPSVMAAEAKSLGAAMVHYSTDYVFDGSKLDAYLEDDATGPLSVYGRSKLAGERAIIDAGIDYLILRTSWVYGMRGKNFLLTMLRLAVERDQLHIVDDQYGAPTWSRTIADTTALILAQARVGQQPWWRENSGVYHLSSQGSTTWFGFAQAIFETAGVTCQLHRIGSADYPVPACRPSNSVLSSARLIERFCALPDWKQALHLCMEK